MGSKRINSVLVELVTVFTYFIFHFVGGSGRRSGVGPTTGVPK